MRILITGGSGFIGQRLAPRLAGDHEVLQFEADLSDGDATRVEVAAKQPEVIVHLAARTEVESSFQEPVDFSSVNYVGTVRLIEAARKLDSLRLFVFASTMETYGWQPESDELLSTGAIARPRAFDEETPQHPNAPYAVAKLGCERYLEYVGRAFDFPWTALRQTNTYGRTDNDFFVVEQFITQMLQRPDEVEFGDPRPYRNFLYIDDLIDLYVRVVANPELARGQYFCTGPDNALPVADLAALIAGMAGWQGQIQWHRKPDRPGEIFYLNSTHAKASRILGWEPRVALEDGLARTIEHWRARLGAGRRSDAG